MDEVFTIHRNAIKIPKNNLLPKFKWGDGGSPIAPDMNWEHLDSDHEEFELALPVIDSMMDQYPTLAREEGVQFNYYNPGSEFHTHLDDGCEISAIVGISNSHDIVFAYHKSLNQLGSILSPAKMKAQKVVDVVRLNRGDLVVINNIKSVKAKIGHGIPKQTKRSVSGVMRD